MQVRSRRILAVSLSTGVVAAMLAVTALTSIAYAGPGESGFVAAINAERAQNGLPAYAVAGDLEGMARAQAQRMADKLAIYHNPHLASEACCWSSLGENVGEGAGVDQLVPVFYASPEHRANILSAAFTQVAVGTAVGSDGQLYVDEVFRLPTDTAAAAPHPARTTRAQPTPAPPKASDSAAPTPPVTTTPATTPATTPLRPAPTRPAATPAPTTSAAKPAPTTTAATAARTPAAHATRSALSTTPPAVTSAGPAAHPTLAALVGDQASSTAPRQRAAPGDPPTAGAAPAHVPTAGVQLGRSAQAGSRLGDLDRANRSEVRVPLFVLSDAQHDQLVQVLRATPTGADPLASSLRWWRAMDALAG